MIRKIYIAMFLVVLVFTSCVSNKDGFPSSIVMNPGVNESVYKFDSQTRELVRFDDPVGLFSPTQNYSYILLLNPDKTLRSFVIEVCWMSAGNKLRSPAFIETFRPGVREKTVLVDNTPSNIVDVWRKLSLIDGRFRIVTVNNIVEKK